jgi:hypothetical protein
MKAKRGQQANNCLAQPLNASVANGAHQKPMILEQPHILPPLPTTR